MKYVGIKPSSSIKPYYKTKFSHEKKVNGKVVKYYECWIEVKAKPAFKDDKLNIQKIKDLDKKFNNKKKKF